jgi:hypothetical protein
MKNSTHNTIQKMLQTCLILAVLPLISSQNTLTAIDSDFLFLDVRRSTLPSKYAGLGVFAKSNIPPNEILCEFRGVVVGQDVQLPFISNSLLMATSGNGESLQLVGDVVEKKSICSYINDCAYFPDFETPLAASQIEVYNATNISFPLYSGFDYNSKRYATKNGKVFIVSSVAIEADQEIFFSYGKDFWLPRLSNPSVYFDFS